MTVKEVLLGAREAASRLALLSTEEKNRALLAMADALETNIEKILRANREDLENAKQNCMNPIKRYKE